MSDSKSKPAKDAAPPPNGRAAPPLVAQCKMLVKEELDRVEVGLASTLTTDRTEFAEPVRYFLMSGGKRIRAMLVLLAARATDADMDAATRLAIAAELVHGASLCHDDVLDRGTVRRGAKTLRSAFGDATSILVGDYCLAHAFRCAALADPKAMDGLSRTVATMAEGEVLQVHFLENGAGIDDYAEVVRRKTGQLFAWCASLGGMSDGYSSDLVEYGQQLGLAYQISNDVRQFCLGLTKGAIDQEASLSYPMILERGQTIRETFGAADSPESVVEGSRLASQAAAARALQHLERLPPSPHADALGGLARFAATYADDVKPDVTNCNARSS